MSNGANGNELMLQDVSVYSKVSGARNSGFIPGLQVSRAFAAATVVIFHTIGTLINGGVDALPEPWPFQAGVDIFFIISGFVMMHVENGAGTLEAIRFFKRRLARILPLYWIFTTISLILYMYNHRYLGLHLSEARMFVKSYLFWPYSADPSQKWNFAPLYAVGWTLNYEMFFYFVFGIAMIVHKRGRLTIVMAVLFFGVALGRMFDFKLPVYFWTDPIILEFGLGMTLSIVYRRNVLIPQSLRLPFFMAILIWFAVGWLYRSEISDALTPFEDFWRVLIWGIPSCLLVWVVVSSRWSSDGRVNRFLLFLGAASYSIYLTHPLALHAMGAILARTGLKEAGATTALTIALVMYAAAIASGLGVYVMIERRISAGLKAAVRPTAPTARRQTVS